MLRRLVSVACVVAVLLCFSSSAHAQGCVLCYTSALAAGKSVQNALQTGVMVLLVPVSLLFLTVAAMIWRSGSSS